MNNIKDNEDGALHDDGPRNTAAVGHADSSRMKIRKESLDYFDCMEVLYYDDMLHQHQQQQVQESSESSSTSSESAEEEKGESTKEENDVDIGGNNNKDEKNSMVIVQGGGRAHRNRTRLRKMAHERRKLLENTIRSRRRKLKAIMSEPGFVMTMDKLSFVCGVLTIMVIEAVLLLAPERMDTLYTALLIPLMVARYIIYRADLIHYFMYDFCYYAQVLLLIYMYKLPDNIELGKAMFSIGNGPLCIAIIMWRNSLVFHSMDKMTSMFIHILPPLVMFSRRWGDHLAKREFPLYKRIDGTILSILKDFWLGPFCLYLLWQAIYLVKTEVISKRKLEYNTDMMTSLRWLTRKKNSTSYKLISVFGEHNQLPTFVLIQAVYTLVTFLVIPLLWHSIWLHSIYLGVIFIIALANGATYYFHVFAKRYIEEIGKLVSGDKVESKI